MIFSAGKAGSAGPAKPAGDEENILVIRAFTHTNSKRTVLGIRSSSQTNSERVPLDKVEGFVKGRDILSGE